VTRLDRLWHWTVVGAVLSALILFAVSFIAAEILDPARAVSTLSTTILASLLVAVPGAVFWTGYGLLVRTLGRALPGPGRVGRGPWLALDTLAAWVVATVLAHLLLSIISASFVPLSWLLYSGAAALPFAGLALVSWLRDTRATRRSPARGTGPTGRPAAAARARTGR